MQINLYYKRGHPGRLYPPSSESDYLDVLFAGYGTGNGTGTEVRLFHM